MHLFISFFVTDFVRKIVASSFSVTDFRDAFKLIDGWHFKSILQIFRRRARVLMLNYRQILNVKEPNNIYSRNSLHERERERERERESKNATEISIYGIFMSFKHVLASSYNY